jgi:hypothetical protein
MSILTRRGFCELASGVSALPLWAEAQTLQTSARQITEWSFISGSRYKDPFNEIELDVAFEGPGGRRMQVPAFWAGENTWRVRFAPPEPGNWTWRSTCSDHANADLHGKSGAISAMPAQGGNALSLHGPIRVRADHRHFEHEDGTPFFWLGDTWWMGLCHRFSFPQDFQRLAADRIAKGFNVVQIVAGLYPDMPPFDPRGANEAGYPWEPEYARINPPYFDMADLRIEYLTGHGIVPCIVGCWGYFLPVMGDRRMKQHWRNIVARWGALPVVWCLAGEGDMPYYLSKTIDADKEAQKRGWTEMARYVRSIDAYRHPITIHPSSAARTTVNDPSVVDFDMLQTGHSDRQSIPNTVARVRASYSAEPIMPVLVGEVCYEGIMQASREEVQRFMIWASILSGAAGHTYGANGIWQVNTAEAPFGPSPHGRSWGDTPWETAYQLAGSAQVGLAKQLLSKYQWWRIEPHQEWVEPSWTPQNPYRSFAAGIPRELRIVYIPDGGSPSIQGLEPGLNYRAFYWNPVNGKESPIGQATGDASGKWTPPPSPIIQDWILVLQTA